MRRALRTVFAVAVWLPVAIVDRLRGLDPPARLDWALAWAREERQPTIRTADRRATIRTRRDPRRFCATCCANEGEEHLDWCQHEGVVVTGSNKTPDGAHRAAENGEKHR